MKRRTLVSRLQEQRLKVLKEANLELVAAGIKTITNHGGTGPVTVEEDPAM